jgi:hypothetical protein
MRNHVVVVSLLIVAVLAGGCPRDIPEIPVINPKLTDDEQIMKILNDVHDGMQSQRIYQIMAHVSRGYKDAEGRDYDALAAYLNKVFEEYRSIRVTRVKPRVVVQGNQARAVETFGTIAKPDNRADYPPIDLHGQVTVFFEKVDNRWLIVEWGSIR